MRLSQFLHRHMPSAMVPSPPNPSVVSHCNPPLQCRTKNPSHIFMADQTSEKSVKSSCDVADSIAYLQRYLLLSILGQAAP